MINSGMFRHKIIIQNKKSVTDDIGQQINRWVDYFNCYAYVSNLSGREFWEAKQQHEENTTEFIIRYCKAVSTPDHFQDISYEPVTQMRTLRTREDYRRKHRRHDRDSHLLAADPEKQPHRLCQLESRKDTGRSGPGGHKRCIAEALLGCGNQMDGQIFRQAC